MTIFSQGQNITQDYNGVCELTKRLDQGAVGQFVISCEELKKIYTFSKFTQHIIRSYLTKNVDTPPILAFLPSKQQTHPDPSEIQIG